MKAFRFVAIPICLGLISFPGYGRSQATDGMARTQIQGIDIPAIPNAPFTAKVTVVWKQPLIGGGTLSRSYYTMVARDTQGRVHREIRDFVPANSTAEPNLRSFSILDPVAGTRTVCSQETMSCTTSAFQPQISLNGNAPLTASSSQVKRESLGQTVIDGLPANGVREISTGSAGVPGNSQLVVSNRELWFSPDLQIDLSVTRNNPQLGVIALSVTNLIRGQPDASWFTVPSGYDVGKSQNQ